MDAIPWFAWIAIVGIAAWAVVASVQAATGPRRKEREELTEALHANTEAQTRTGERLDAIEQRLTTIESTLNDVP